MQGWHITRFQAIFVVLHKHYYISFTLWHEPSVGLGYSLFICVHAYLDTIAAHLFDTCVKNVHRYTHISDNNKNGMGSAAN